MFCGPQTSMTLVKLVKTRSSCMLCSLCFVMALFLQQGAMCFIRQLISWMRPASLRSTG